MGNQHDLYTTPGQVTVTAYDIDDQCNVWINGDKVWGDGGHPINRHFDIRAGQSIVIRFELYNMTGGRYHADFAVNSPSGTLYNHSADGVGGPQNITFSEQVNVIAR